MPAQTVRELLERTVLERSQHRSKDDARDTWSFARAERLLSKEYHGRFLIELLQNAADAWRTVHGEGETCGLAVVIDESPALVVANRGAPFAAETVLRSLGQIGSSTKTAGEAIGHKGIGFKSVLEVTATPEVYSGFTGGVPSLAVKLDASRALDTIRAETPEWDAWVRGEKEFKSDPLQAVPALRYPSWVEEPPEIVTELGGRGYDTVVRLPSSSATGGKDQWLGKITDALDDVSDQILVLLGSFHRLRIDDLTTGWSEDIVVKSGPALSLAGSVSRDEVVVVRNGQATSRWLRYRQGEADESNLASETIVAIRVDVDDVRRPVPAQGDGDTSSPFHLFFPTLIGSGLPFLLHGYFEVNAARTGFFRGAAQQNEEILSRLADLVVLAVEDVATRQSVDLASLAELVTTTPPPEDELARGFLGQVLAGLDDVPWIPTAHEESAPPAARPSAMLSADPTVTRALVHAFPVSYLRERTGLEIPHPDLAESVYSFLHARCPDRLDELWSHLHAVLRPGERHPWPADSRADQHFQQLLNLTDALRRLDPARTGKLLQGLAGDEQTRLIPVTRHDAGRDFVAVPDPDSSTAGNRGVSVLARLGGTEVDPLDPPSVLDVRFIADGLLSSDDLDRAKPFGVRPFTVDSVLDRLNKVSDLGGSWRPSDDEHGRLVRFLWDLLSRERRSEFSTASTRGRALTFASPDWFWLQPGRSSKDEPARLRQRRERNLAGVPLPARDGTWRAAETLALGADWADWVEAQLPYADRERRVAAMRRLELVAPDPGCLLAPPAEVLKLLPTSSVTNRLRSAAEVPNPEKTNQADDATEPDIEDPTIDDLTPQEQEKRAPLEQLAFLLRLGCWEVPPVEGHETRQARVGAVWPWPDTRRGLAPEEDRQKWNFDTWRWAGTGHRNITVTEDTRLRWPLGQERRELQLAMAESVADGAALYSRLTHASALCPSCTTSAGNNHQKRYYTQDADRRPSTLALQLQRQPWIPAAQAGNPVGARSPREVWWDPRGLDAHALRTSPLQHLVLAEVATWSASLRALCGVQSLAEARPERLLQLHADLRAAMGDLTSSSERQTFVLLHRRIYEALSFTDPAADLPEDFEVLCELGSRLVHRHRDECRHDDGKYVGYKGRFGGRVPFVVLARDKQSVALALGVPPFEVTVVRRDDGSEGEGEDITATLRDELTDRIPEILAVMVHHSGGTAPLDPTGDAFKERADRLKALRVRRLKNLILDASAVGLPEVRETIGDTSQDESYLDTSRPGSPVIYHDFTGEEWRSRLRRRLAVHLAALSDVAAAYTDTFTLLLTAGESEREELLQSWGVTPAHVLEIQAQTGIFNDEDRSRTRNWLRALLTVLGRDDAPDDADLDRHRISELLVRTGLQRGDADDVADGLISPKPGDPSGSVLPILHRHHVDLRVLSDALSARGEPRLCLRVARDRLDSWLREQEPRLVAVLVTATAGLPEVDAKSVVRAISPPPELEFTLDPTPTEYLAPVVALLGQQGLHTEADQLAAEPTDTLANLAGLSIAQLDEAARGLYDPEARGELLAQRAKGWSTELQLLSLLARAAGATPSAIRSEAEQVARQIGHPVTPSALVPVLKDLLPGEQLSRLRHALENLLVDDLPGTPADRKPLLTIAASHGLQIAEAQRILDVLAAPRDARVAKLTHQRGLLKQHDVTPRRPKTLPPPPEPPVKPEHQEPKNVPPVTVGPNADRKKKAGDEAESWALAALLTPLLALDEEERRTAVGQMLALLDHYRIQGGAVVQLRAHAQSAVAPGLDEEEQTLHLSELVHASKVSDAFGFDMLGWIPNDNDPGVGRPMAIEVKSSSDGTFYFSSGEWKCADRMRASDESSAAYAVLAVRRKGGSDTPVAMDLLVDPVYLKESGKLRLDTDTYCARYVVSRSSQ